MKTKTNLILLASIFLSSAAYCGPFVSGGVPGRQLVSCEGSYKKGRSIFAVDFNVRITPGANMGIVNVSSKTAQLNLSSYLVEDANDPRGYTYTGQGFVVLVPGNQPPNDLGTYTALLTAVSVNKGQTLSLTCKR